METHGIDVIWWITVIGLPALGGLCHSEPGGKGAAQRRDMVGP